MPTLLTPAEEEIARDDYGWLSLFWLSKGEGEYFYSEGLQSNILVFKKADGVVLFVRVDQDYSAGDPSAVEYVIGETLDAIGENTQEVVGGITKTLNVVPWILGLSAVIIFKDEIRGVFKAFKK